MINRTHILASFFTVALLCLPAPALAQQKLEVLDQYFFGETIDNGVALNREKTTRIPNIPDKMCFGWVVKVKPSDELVKITEIFTLPAPPATWGGIDEDPYSQTRTTDQGQVATTKMFVSLAKGTLENSWCLTKGDQNGTHHIVILHQKQVLAEFEFEVYR